MEPPPFTLILSRLSAEKTLCKESRPSLVFTMDWGPSQIYACSEVDGDCQEGVKNVTTFKRLCAGFR